MALTPTQLLADQLKNAHESLIATLDGVTNEVANWQPQGKANAIGATWAHLAVSDDMFIGDILSGTGSLVSKEWKDKTGLSQPHPTSDWSTYPDWLKNVRVDVEALMDYTKAVFAASEAYVASLSLEQLEETKDMTSMGSSVMTVASVLDNMVIGHCHDITGEISALKGVQGLKGYPW